ncbi:uncharacterized protein AMSG_07012 [Thecamonas trahens ATCC 50062]|uniref:Uncharacterized protein n=1 Tax=Thecamonas trahens ATCC 50062 TaxID=461836 RepID=A0A0L0DFG5_THETB|nr:hypothetical protein AMSG_07012 [Thecamonas trahens ATCC 50062]KNC51034.1 hypothetical protein AMSG_07012 [Thecamonas trahens ATCC 50062]|eukprot:XP_013756501.1 hypothetical protein AMSG_07012 [Thecamonas trahens ATCC 50062]
MSEAPEEVEELPGGWGHEANEFERLCLLRCFRTDRVYVGVSRFVVSQMGERYVQPPVVSIKSVFDQSTPTAPIVFVLSPGSDPPCLDGETGAPSQAALQAMAEAEGMVMEDEEAVLTAAGAPDGTPLADVLAFSCTPHSYAIPAVLAVLAGSACFEILAPSGARHRVAAAAGDVIGIGAGVLHTMEVPGLEAGEFEALVTRSMFVGESLPGPEAQNPTMGAWPSPSS